MNAMAQFVSATTHEIIGCRSLSPVVRKCVAAKDRGCAKTWTQKSLVENYSSPGASLLVHPANIVPARAYVKSFRWENTRKQCHGNGLCACRRNAMRAAIDHPRKKILRFFNPYTFSRSQGREPTFEKIELKAAYPSSHEIATR